MLQICIPYPLHRTAHAIAMRFCINTQACTEAYTLHSIRYCNIKSGMQIHTVICTEILQICTWMLTVLICIGKSFRMATWQVATTKSLASQGLLSACSPLHIVKDLCLISRPPLRLIKLAMCPRGLSHVPALVFPQRSNHIDSAVQARVSTL